MILVIGTDRFLSLFTLLSRYVKIMLQSPPSPPLPTILVLIAKEGMKGTRVIVGVRYEYNKIDIKS